MNKTILLCFIPLAFSAHSTLLLLLFGEQSGGLRREPLYRKGEPALPTIEHMAPGSRGCDASRILLFISQVILNPQAIKNIKHQIAKHKSRDHHVNHQL
ncbi:hypothetical protein HOY82DRAFT_565454 [Tuber indicum]|nr:hypothetical protein HOY82DRAFT_565454 [Tuber indicum]